MLDLAPGPVQISRTQDRGLLGEHLYGLVAYCGACLRRQLRDRPLDHLGVRDRHRPGGHGDPDRVLGVDLGGEGDQRPRGGRVEPGYVPQRRPRGTRRRLGDPPRRHLPQQAQQ